MHFGDPRPETLSLALVEVMMSQGDDVVADLENLADRYGMSGNGLRLLPQLADLVLPADDLTLDGIGEFNIVLK